MTTYPISGPPKVAATESLKLSTNQGVMVSPFSGSQIITNNYATWQLTLGYNSMFLADAKAFTAWRASLRGSAGTFTYQPYGSGRNLTGRTLASACFPGSSTMEVQGWAANASSQLEAGDYFSLANNLFQIISVDANADANGRVTIEFSPWNRILFAAGHGVQFQYPKGIFRLEEDDEGAGLTRDSNTVNVGSVKAVQAV